MIIGGNFKPEDSARTGKETFAFICEMLGVLCVQIPTLIVTIYVVSRRDLNGEA